MEFNYLDLNNKEQVINYFFEYVFSEDKETATHIRIKGGEVYYMIKDEIDDEHNKLKNKMEVLDKWEQLVKVSNNHFDIFLINMDKAKMYEKEKILYQHRQSLNEKLPSIEIGNNTISINGNNNVVKDITMNAIIIISDGDANSIFGTISFSDTITKMLNNGIPWKKYTEDERIKILQRSIKYNCKDKTYSINDDGKEVKIDPSILDYIHYNFYNNNGVFDRERLSKFIKSNLKYFVIKDEMDLYKNILISKGSRVEDKRTKESYNTGDIIYNINREDIIDIPKKDIEDNIRLLRIIKFNEIVDKFRSVCKYEQGSYALNLKLLYGNLISEEYISYGKTMKIIIGDWGDQRNFTTFIHQFTDNNDTKYQAKKDHTGKIIRGTSNQPLIFLKDKYQ